MEPSNCRFCGLLLKTRSTKAITPEIAEQFYNITKVQLKSDFALPSNACNTCVKDIWEIKKKIEKWTSNEKFRQASSSAAPLTKKPTVKHPVEALKKVSFNPVIGVKEFEASFVECESPKCGRKFKNQAGMKIHMRSCGKKKKLRKRSQSQEEPIIETPKPGPTMITRRRFTQT